MDRRGFLRRLAVTGGLSVSGPLLALASSACTDKRVREPLEGAGALLVPKGWHYKIISRQGEEMSDGNPTPSRFDGMAAFAGENGTTILLRNHENKGEDNEVDVAVPETHRYDGDSSSNGGVTRLVVSADRGVMEARAVLGGTSHNCAGGPVPWGAWLSCEETFGEGDVPHGYVFEVDARASDPVEAVPIRAAGRMVHEAVAWWDGVLYLTEDQHDAALYRLIPDSLPRAVGDLAASTGRLQALAVLRSDSAETRADWPVGEGFAVEWVDIEEPEPDSDTVRDEAHSKGAAVFDRTEGAWSADGRIYFSCTDAGSEGRGQVWELDPVHAEITLLYESPGPDELNHPDNLVVAPGGGLLVCEDNDSFVRIRRLTPDGRIHDFAAANADLNSEFCGVCFDPSGSMLFVNQQGDPSEGLEGVTYAIWGAWDSL